MSLLLLFQGASAAVPPVKAKSDTPVRLGQHLSAAVVSIPSIGGGAFEA